MKKNNETCLSLGKTRKVALFFVLGWVLCSLCAVHAQNVRIRYRPLTPQDISDFGLTNTTQRSGGTVNVGIGQPFYMEALVSTSTVITNVTWTIIGSPTDSVSAVIQTSPLSNSVPIYDGGDRVGSYVAGRALFVPDVRCDTENGDFTIRADLYKTNGSILSYTNKAYGSVFLGHGHYLCVLCHASKQTNYDLTAHATVFTRAITGEDSDHFGTNYLASFTLGYDTTAGATNNGFDDIATQLGWTYPGTEDATNWSGLSSSLQNKANVLCESCHGPADRHMQGLGDTNAITVSLSSGLCGQCHDNFADNNVKKYEWSHSLHATGEVFRFGSSCTPCHSAKGFIGVHDPDYDPAATNYPHSTTNEGFACATCHDPHEVGMGDSQLRNLTTATFSNGTIITSAEAGMGVLCMNCHHARRDAITYVTNTSMSSSWGPHHGVQGDLVAGINGIEYGLDMPSSRHMTAVTNSCVGCHMQLIENTAYSNSYTKVGGHTFKVFWEGETDDTNDDIRVTQICSGCHVEEDTFDFGGEDYDRDGTVEGVQTEIEGLATQLAILLPPTGSTSVTFSSSYTLAQRQAAWNYMLVWIEDGSRGVHNPKYAAALLRASIDDLSGGIDVDQDGLLDSWEMDEFGDLTTQTGDDDSDGDGLSNALEEDIGTDPNDADTDSDGLSDLAEIQGYSDPLDISSVLPTNTVLDMLSAVELMYMPGSAGVTQAFQYVDAMGDSDGWTNIGSTFVSSNSPSYQLISIRDTTQKYYRVKSQ